MEHIKTRFFLALTSGENGSDPMVNGQVVDNINYEERSLGNGFYQEVVIIQSKPFMKDKNPADTIKNITINIGCLGKPVSFSYDGKLSEEDKKTITEILQKITSSTIVV